MTSPSDLLTITRTIARLALDRAQSAPTTADYEFAQAVAEFASEVQEHLEHAPAADTLPPLSGHATVCTTCAGAGVYSADGLMVCTTCHGVGVLA
jgi:DnaJ-class molecular chaperone